MKKALGIFVRHILLQLLEIIASNKVAEVLIAQQHIDLWVTSGYPTPACMLFSSYFVSPSVIGPKEAVIRTVI